MLLRVQTLPGAHVVVVDVAVTVDVPDRDALPIPEQLVQSLTMLVSVTVTGGNASVSHSSMKSDIDENGAEVTVLALDIDIVALWAETPVAVATRSMAAPSRFIVNEDCLRQGRKK